MLRGDYHRPEYHFGSATECCRSAAQLDPKDPAAAGELPAADHLAAKPDQSGAVVCGTGPGTVPADEPALSDSRRERDPCHSAAAGASATFRQSTERGAS